MPSSFSANWLRVVGTKQRSSLLKKALGREPGAQATNSPLSSQESRGSLSYSNSVTGRTRGHPGRVVLRHRVPQLKVTCRVDGPSAVEVVPGENASYDVSISFLELPLSQHGENTGQHYASRRKEVFLQATLHSPNPSLRLFVDTCVASPDPSDFTTVKYDLIKQG